jgi:pimeloyl-ACP methyl ester carboxylesterase
MCNPNALYYQQMVTSPNAYWLNFFLKRDINVLCWNYRGYGESSRKFLETLSPYKSKRDAEYVLAFLVNRLKVKGKIGVYGRSIGGLTACHLANMYKDLIKSLIVDRSFYELSTVPKGKMKGEVTSTMFDLLSWKWRTRNHTNFAQTTNCYKIITCDPLDDTVDLFGNLNTGVASQLTTVDYETK